MRHTKVIVVAGLLIGQSMAASRYSIDTVRLLSYSYMVQNVLPIVFTTSPYGHFGLQDPSLRSNSDSMADLWKSQFG